MSLLFVLLSILVAHSTLQVLLAATGTLFFLCIGGWLLYVNKYISYPLQMMIIALMIAIGAYTIWHLLSKKYDNMHRYLFLQMFGAISLAFALCTFAVTINIYLFPKTEFEKLLTDFEERLELSRKEQRALLMHDPLNKVQKNRYVELIHESKAIATEEFDKLQNLNQIIIEFFDYKVTLFTIFAVLCILLGTLLNVPLAISFGLIFSGGCILLLPLISLYLSGSMGLASYSLLIRFFIYILFVAAMLAFTGYRLYHQPKE